ncbi:ABC transporter permease [Nocardia aurantia]|uniref:Putative D,D-dipeptide transport system permease protein DdpC n=1 Tax=Nocardia aurantia TaxID=2585199 RepID=A0A7K0DSU1_9NOCA|nr:ABC transporter permease [Nocardia aurantia]MQY28432.1 putative D,D-dipeptide transport system permease protein DdpC [Nocardia aurantia]
MTATAAGVPRARPIRIRSGRVLAGLTLLVVATAVLAPGLLAGSPESIDPGVALRAPSAAHPFGTDWLGRDEYARVVYGARASLLVGLGSTVCSTVAGTLWGLAAALGGRLADRIAMRAADVLLAFPTILMALLVVAVLGPGTGNVVLAISIALTPGFARLVRIRTHLVRQFAYVRAALDLGTAPWRVTRRHIVPNVLLPLGVLVVINIGTAIIIGSSLSFLGLGPDSGTPEWGAMLAQSRNYLGAAWTLALFPGLAVTVTVMAISVLGRALRARVGGALDE